MNTYLRIKMDRLNCVARDKYQRAFCCMRLFLFLSEYIPKVLKLQIVCSPFIDPEEGWVAR